jgi:hypothetical protein
VPYAHFFVLRWPDLDRTTTLVQQSRIPERLVPVLRLYTHKGLGYATLSQQLIECLLQIGLLADGEGARGGVHFVCTLRSKVSKQSLKGITPGLGRFRSLGRCGSNGGDTVLDATIANEAGISRQHLANITGRAMAKLAATFGDH